MLQAFNVQQNVENIFTMYYILDIMLYLLALIFLNNN